MAFGWALRWAEKNSQKNHKYNIPLNELNEA